MNGLSVFNIKDPLDELLFIICSTKTDEANYRKSFRALKETFTTHLQIVEAPAEYIARPIEPESQGDSQPSRHHRGAVWRAVAQVLARDGRQGGRKFSVVAAGGGQENGALRFDVFAGQAGFSGGHALLAYRQASRLGQADTEGQALRAARYGSPAIQNPA